MNALPERFTSKFTIDAETGCWVWTASKTAKGYGRFYLDGRKQLAHRVAYAAFNGDIPDGRYLDHLCRNRACCNPEHLEVVTNRENHHRGMEARNGSRDVCPQGHALTAGNLVASQLACGRRKCLTCHREYAALRNAVASALGKSWSTGVHAARRDPRVKAIVRKAYNWQPASDAEAEELAELVDAVNRIESGRRLTKPQKVKAVYRPPA